MIDPTTATFRNGPQGLAPLRAATVTGELPSTDGDPREVAQKFEAIFVQQFVAAMRSSAEGLGEGMFGKESGNDTYTQWFDQFMAEHITRHEGLGLAKVIEQDMGRHHQRPSGVGQGMLPAKVEVRA
jgi:flagellar protein FlgJ